MSNDPQPPGGLEGGWGDDPVVAPRNGLGTAGLVLGIVAVLGALLYAWIGVLVGLVGLVVSAAALRRVRRGEAGNRGAALAGAALSALGFFMSLALIVLVLTSAGR